MGNFIDISISPSDTERRYLVFLFRDGVLCDVTRHADIASVVAMCLLQALPVVSIDPHVRRDLRAHGIESHPPAVQIVGR